MRRARASTLWALLGGFIFTVSVSAAQQPVCPPMPDKITQVNRDVRSEVDADIGSLGKLKTGHVGVKTDVVAKNLFEKYPNTDRVVVVEMMAATYCSMIRDSKTLKESEKLSLWSEFSERIFKFENPSYNPAPTPSKSKSQSKPTPKDSPAQDQNSRTPTRITPSQKTGDYYIDNVLEKISEGERNPNWSEGERSSAMEGLFERAAFSCAGAQEESWPELLWAVAATRIVIEDNIPAFGQHPETKNHLNEAAGVLLKMEKDAAFLWGDSFDPTAAMHNYFRNHDEFIHHLPGMVNTPHEDLQVKRDQNVKALRKALKGYIPIAADSSCDENQKTESPATGSPEPAEGAKDEAVQPAKAANPSSAAAGLAGDQNGSGEPTAPVPYGRNGEGITSPKTSTVRDPNTSPGKPQTSNDLLRQIEEMLEKDRELSELRGCPTADRVQLRIIGGKISYTTCIHLCSASWVNVDPRRLDFTQIDVSQDDDPELATVTIPCAKDLDFCARISEGTTVGPFSWADGVCKKKKTLHTSRFFVMDVHAKNADAIADLWKRFARAGF
jgi:hypothetical protein